MVAQTLFGIPAVHGQPARGLTRPPARGQDWRPWTNAAAGSSETNDSAATENVMYKIRKSPLNNAEILPMLNVTSRVNWLKMDDGYLLNSFDVLREGILGDVFAQKCSNAWQGAPGQRLTISIMLPGQLEADEWFDLMLTHKNLWPTFTLKGFATDTVTEKAFRRERRKLQAKHLYMEVKLHWDILRNRMYTSAPTGKSPQELDDLLFNKAFKSSTVDPYQERAYRGPGYRAVEEKWKQQQEWMSKYCTYRKPVMIDMGWIVQCFQRKEESARNDIDTYMEYCAKRWQTKEGTYRLKKRKLLPDVRDPPDLEGDEVDQMDI